MARSDRKVPGQDQLCGGGGVLYRDPQARRAVIGRGLREIHRRRSAQAVEGESASTGHQLSRPCRSFLSCPCRYSSGATRQRRQVSRGLRLQCRQRGKGSALARPSNVSPMCWRTTATGFPFATTPRALRRNVRSSSRLRARWATFRRLRGEWTGWSFSATRRSSSMRTRTSLSSIRARDEWASRGGTGDSEEGFILRCRMSRR